MVRFILKKATLYAIVVAACIAPLAASAQTASGITGWLSHLFNWQSPLISHVSALLDARKDTVESNSNARNQLLNWRRGIVSIDASSSGSYSSSPTDGDASSSPLLIPYNLFEEKRSAIVIELVTAENSLRSNASDLANFISDSTASSNDMSTAQSALSMANSDIDSADEAISAFKDYEPNASSSSDLVNLQAPQSYLEAAITAIQMARAALKSAIAAAGSSLQ
jgi:hypothetical protein